MRLRCQPPTLENPCRCLNDTCQGKSFNFTQDDLYNEIERSFFFASATRYIFILGNSRTAPRVPRHRMYS